MTDDPAPHAPVLAEEVVRLVVGGGGERLGEALRLVDCTLGAGGHAERLLEASGPGGRVLGLDRDAEALAIASERLGRFGDRVRIVKGRFSELEEIVGANGWEGGCDGVLYDFGVSSMQLDRPGRGFSYHRDEPLDMRMDPSQRLSAREVVNGYAERELASVIRRYGEERWASRIARFVVAARSRSPIETTGRLVDVIKDAIPHAARRGGPHPARRTFQALRIEVNGELDAIESSLPQAVSVLRGGGRLVALSYHSLEDRIVKRFLVRESGGEAPRLRKLTRKPIVPGEAEVAANPRASAAKLRAAERLAAPPSVAPGPPEGSAA